MKTQESSSRPLWIGLLSIVFLACVLVIALALLIQLVPYGRNHINPPVLSEPNWDSPQTRELARRACFDCHSNQTVWPWYSQIAPMSWLVQKDVDEGREKLNFSEWGNARVERERETDEIGEVIREGRMPPSSYLLLHPDARLSQAEKEALIRGLESSLR